MSRPESPVEWMESEASSGCVWLTVTPLSSFSSWWQLVAIVWCWWSWEVCVCGVGFGVNVTLQVRDGADTGLVEEVLVKVICGIFSELTL